MPTIPARRVQQQTKMDGADDPGDQRIGDVDGPSSRAAWAAVFEFFEGGDGDPGPGVPGMGFAGRDQFAQMAVFAPEVLIRHQPVMDRDTAKPGEGPGLVHAEQRRRVAHWLKARGVRSVAKREPLATAITGAIMGVSLMLQIDPDPSWSAPGTAG